MLTFIPAVRRGASVDDDDGVGLSDCPPTITTRSPPEELVPSRPILLTVSGFSGLRAARGCETSTQANVVLETDPSGGNTW